MISSLASFVVQVGTVAQILKPADLKAAGRMPRADGGLAGMRPTSTCQTGGGHPLARITCLDDHKRANSSAVDFFPIPEVSTERVPWRSPDPSPTRLWDARPSRDELMDVPMKPQG